MNRRILRRMAGLTVLLTLLFGLCGCTAETAAAEAKQAEPVQAEAVSVESVPEYSGDPYVVLADNHPDFDESDYTTQAFEEYAELDELGRCGTAFANVCPNTMPTEERGSISSVKPSGWQSVRYDFVDGKSLYNRCHLIGFQLTAENANRGNLITGTRYLNVTGMLPFENLVADYVKDTGNHVLYRVTPVFEGEELVARGVEMEAWSVEDEGDGICFHVYCYNVQPGVGIDYADGTSWEEQEETNGEEHEYVLNTNNRKFHRPDCGSVKQMKDKNREDYTGTREMLIRQGYEPCGQCRP